MKKVFHHKCALCKRTVANKTNSHIIPSFIVCKTASSDGSGKRNHELVYSISKTIQTYVGNEVPDKVIERTFDNLSDERIEKELKNNPFSKDYVFCSSCEKALGDYLESPYASKINMNPQTAYFCWLSVLWRVNHFEILGTKIPKFILSELRKSLDAYLQARKKGVETNHIKQKYPFNYRIMICKDYSVDGDGCIYAEYDKQNRIFSITLGDIIICYNLKNNTLPDRYSFLELENELREAPLNDGKNNEVEKVMSSSIFAKAYRNLLNKIHIEYINNEICLIRRFWNILREENVKMPSPVPSALFIQRCLLKIHDDKKKLGERYTNHNLAVSFYDAMKEIYEM